MADPLSIAASTLAVVHVAKKAVGFIWEAQKGTKNIDKVLETLVGDIKSVQSLCEQVSKTFDDDVAEDSNVPTKDEEAGRKLWRETSGTLKDCEAILEDLGEVVKKITRRHDSSQLTKYLKKRSKDDELGQLWERLKKKRDTLQIQLTLLQITITRKSQVDQFQSFDKLSLLMTSLTKDLKDQISALQDRPTSSLGTRDETGGILATAASIQKLASLNVHFDIPRSVDPMFTGRELQLVTLKEAFRESRLHEGTKRFVVYGIAGSGKTQLCCKFAQENRQNFWGVFWIDASNAASVSWSYKNIAEMARKEPNERSIKHWLSEQTKPWLLIVDNVDDNITTHPPDSFFPESSSGLVLLNTRNHSLRLLGNIGPRSFEFKGLEEAPSTALLLCSAGKSQPFQPQAMQLAKSICTKLGFLPIAIAIAGAAIRQGRCKLETCLTVLETCWTVVRETIQRTQDGGPQRGSSATDEAAYTTFEMVCTGAQEEAKELLRLLSFMHPGRFSYQILLQAIINPQRQLQADKEAAASKRSSSLPRRSTKRVLRDLLLNLHGSLVQLGERPALPSVLRSLCGTDQRTAEYELRKRLTELRDLALIDHIEADDSYCIHPLVHWWTRDSMTFREKAVWCQMACNVLALGILLPPVGITESDAELRRQAFPHVEHVRKQEREVQNKLQVKQKQRQRSWPTVNLNLRRSDILQYAKFSLVYVECGWFLQAQELLLQVDEFLNKTIGLDHPTAIKARLFLSDTYWWLTNGEEAARLQQELLTICKSSLGDDDVATLTVTDRLGTSMWQLGQFQKAGDLAQQAVDGFQKAYPSGHVDTYRAMTHLGRCVGKLAKFDQAVGLHQEALDGLLGANAIPEHNALVLEVMENLAMAKYDRNRYGASHDDDLLTARKLQEDVLSQREEKLGKEHPLSLWAACNLARLKGASGQLQDAEKMIRQRLPIAERVLKDPAHMGVLFGRTYLAQILMLAGNLVEAEEILLSVDEKHISRKHGKDKILHPDHLVTAAFLLDCYRRQEKYEKADELEEMVLQGTRDNFGKGSPWEDYFVLRYSTHTRAGAMQDPQK